MATKKRQLKREQYTIGWLCALWKSELLAARAMLDEEHEDVDLPYGDENAYTLGSVNGHNVVIACMPASQPGTISASRLVEPLKRSFPNLQMHLFVGIGGGVPRNPKPLKAEEDIFLGDVIVGWPQEVSAPAVVKYDFGRALAHGEFEILSSLDKPSRQVLAALTKLMSNHDIPGHHFGNHLERTRKYERLVKPASERDSLFGADYVHISEHIPNCEACSQAAIVERTQRLDDRPVFHQGIILSGDQVVKDGELRDKLSKKYQSTRRQVNTGDALCFEMEAAGVIDQTNCLVIRGVADYADSHKNSAWHGYAAATAAALGRELLCTMKPRAVTDSSHNFNEPLTFYDYPTDKIAYHVKRSALIDETAAVHADTSKFNHEKVAVLIGLGGCGKTQLALQYCLQSERSGRFEAIYWVDVSSPSTLHQSFTKIAMCFGKPGVSAAEDDGNVQFVLDRLSGSSFPWLLVFDNFDDPELFQGNIQRFFPRGNRGAILVSSRIRSTNALGHALDLSSMSEAESLEILYHKNDHLNKEYTNSSALQVIQILSYHALAVAQARAYIESRQMDFDAFIQDYNACKEAVLRESPSLSEYRRRLDHTTENETRLSVFTTWELSFSQISGSLDVKAAKQHVLTLAGFFDRNAILEVIFRTTQENAPAWTTHFTKDGIWNSQAFRTVLKEMYNLSLFTSLKTHKSGAEFSLHPLIQEWIKVRQSSEAREAYTKEAILLLADCIHCENAYKARYDTQQTYMLHIHSVLKNDGAYLPAGAHLGQGLLISAAQTFAKFCHEHGSHDESLGLSERVICTNQDSLGKKHRTVMMSMSLMGSALMALRRDDEGKKILQDVMELQMEVLGPQHEDTITTRIRLANVLIYQSDFQKAETLLRSLLIAIAGLSDNSSYEFQTMYLLGECLMHQGKYEEAESILRGQLKISVVPTFSLEISLARNDVMCSLAKLLQRRGQYAESEEMFRKSLKWRAEILGEEHRRTFESRDYLAGCLAKQNKHEEAERLYRSKLEIAEKIFGAMHANTLYSILDVANYLQSQRQYEEAEKLVHLALYRCSRKPLAASSDIHVTVFAKICLGRILRRQNSQTEAEAMFRDAVALQKSIYDEWDVYQARAIKQLALLLKSQRRYREAEEQWRQVLRLEGRALVVHHPRRLKSMQDLAECLQRQRKSEEAEEILCQVLIFRNETTEKNDQRKLRSMKWLAYCLTDLGKYDEAESILREVLTQEKLDFDMQHPDPDMLWPMELLEYVLERQEKDSEAQGIRRQIAVLQPENGTSRRRHHLYRSGKDRAKKIPRP